MSYVPPTAGQLRKPLTVERLSSVADGVGGFRGVWEPLIAKVYARVVEERGGEDVRASRLSGISRFDIAIRYSPTAAAITTADRLTDGTRVYAIKWIGDIEGRNRFLHLYCESGGLVDES